MKNFYTKKTGLFHNVGAKYSIIVDGAEGEPYIMEQDDLLGWRCVTFTGKFSPWDTSNSKIFEKAIVSGDFVPFPGKEKEEIDLDELQTETEKLLLLLKNRQPGLITWNGFLKERLENVVKLAAVAGIKSE